MKRTYFVFEGKKRYVKGVIDKSVADFPILKKQYEITIYPTLIIEDTKYGGILSNKELKKIICDSFKNEDSICS